MRKPSKKVSVRWIVWFAIIAALAYSPFIAKYGKASPFILWMPFTLFWWLILTVVLLISIIIFVGGIEE